MQLRSKFQVEANNAPKPIPTTNRDSFLTYTFIDTMRTNLMKGKLIFQANIIFKEISLFESFLLFLLKTVLLVLR